MPGAWERDVGGGAGLPAAARDAVGSWLASTPRSRLQFVRRPGRSPSDRLVFVVHAGERSADVRRFELGDIAALAELDLSAGEPVEHSLVLVCGHGSRDRCCALRGTELFTILQGTLGEEELWISSHQGGHRFAPNLLVLPAGLQFGRVPAREALSVAAQALGSTIELEWYRGRTCYEAAVQAAERAVRRESGLDGVADLVLEAAEGGAISFRTRDGGTCSVVVGEHAGPVVPASCGAEPEAQPCFVAAAVTLTPGSSLGAGRRGR